MPKYISALILLAPFIVTKSFLSLIPYRAVGAVYQSPTPFTASEICHDRFADTKTLGIFREVGKHAFQDIDEDAITQRILKNKPLYEERQRLKLEKRKTNENNAALT